MSCCGNARAQLAARVGQASSTRISTVQFEYIGRTWLSVLGPVTRTTYRFGRPGARLLVDGRDQLALASVPVLRRVGALA